MTHFLLPFATYPLSTVGHAHTLYNSIQISPNIRTRPARVHTTNTRTDPSVHSQASTVDRDLWTMLRELPAFHWKFLPQTEPNIRAR